MVKHQDFQMFDFQLNKINMSYFHPLFVVSGGSLGGGSQIQFQAVKINVKVIYHPLYGMNNYVLIWGDWLSCDPLIGSHDSQSPHIREHLCPILWQL